MKTLKYELEQLNKRKQGLQFVHDYFMGYLVKAGIDKFDKILAENDEISANLIKRAKKVLKH